jgi:hypothetical protein
VDEPAPPPPSEASSEEPPPQQQQQQQQQQQPPPAGTDVKKSKKGKKEAEPELWARVSGVLPRTANSLYAPPFIANITDYEVRYVSVSSVGRSLPYRGYQTLNDKMIAGHYLESVGPDWNRSFVVWLGPPGTGQLPPQVENEHGIFMPWGSSFGGRQIPFPGVLYRQIVSRGQVVGGEGDGGDGAGPHHSGLAEIIPQTCSAEEEPSSVCREDLRCWLEKELCCGRDAPEWCFLPRYVAAKMQVYYPRIEYFKRGSAQQLERIGGDSDGDRILRPLVQEGQPTSSQSGAASKLWENVAMWF